MNIFSKEHGMQSAVAKGVLNKKQQSILQPFQPLTVTLIGKSSLHTLIKPEIETYPPPLPPETLLCGMYCNELLLRLCAEQDPHPNSFYAYTALLEHLRKPEKSLGYYLRSFEWKIFRDIGYALNCTEDINKMAIARNNYYLLDANWKFVAAHNGVYSGSDLLNIANGQFESSALAAKKLSRDILRRIVGTNGLRSWSLFVNKR